MSFDYHGPDTEETTKAIKALDSQEDLTSKLRAASQVFQKTDRIISGDFDLTVSLVTADQVPDDLQGIAGWTDGQSISLNQTVVARLMSRASDSRQRAEVLASVYGVNLHELAHALSSPSVDGPLVTKVATYGPQAFQVLNVLEDQRAERIFLGLYPAATIHLTRMTMEQIVKRATGQDVTGLHMLLHARTWMPASLRAQARDIFSQVYGPQVADQVDPLIEEYVTLVLPRDDARAEAIVLAIMDIFSQAEQQPPSMGQQNHSQQTQQDDQDEDRQEQGQAQADEQDQAMADEDSLTDLGDDDETDEGQDEGTGQDGQDDDGQDSDGEAPQDGQDQGGDSEPGTETGQDDGPAEGQQEASEGTPDEQGTPADGAGDSPSEPASEQSIKDAAEQALEDLKDSQDWADEVHDLDQSVSKELDRMGNDWAKGPEEETRTVLVEAADRRSHRQVKRVFDEIRAELEAAWLHQQDSGRVSIPDVIRTRMVSPGDFDVFDRYEEGAEDATGVELVLLVDKSLSMVGSIKEASRAAWVIKRAVEDLGGRVTVLAYNDQPSVVSHPGQQASRNAVPMLRASGGTRPTQSLVEARRILRQSDMPTKIMVTLTDGDWTTFGIKVGGYNGPRVTSEAVIRDLNQAGVLTALFGLQQAVHAYGDHDCQVAHDLADITDLPKAVEQVVALAIRNVARA